MLLVEHGVLLIKILDLLVSDAIAEGDCKNVNLLKIETEKVIHSNIIDLSLQNN